MAKEQYHYCSGVELIENILQDMGKPVHITDGCDDYVVLSVYATEDKIWIDIQREDEEDDDAVPE